MKRAIFAAILFFPALAMAASMSSYPTKTTPAANDKALISDSAASNATKNVTIGSIWDNIPGTTLSATSPLSLNQSTGALTIDLSGYAATSCFASESAFNACFDLTWASGGATSLSGLSDWPSAVSTTEVGYLDGVTSGIQVQINALSAGSGGTVTVVTSDPYSDAACTGAKYNSTNDRFFPCLGGYHVGYVGLTDFSNPTPADTTPNAFTFGDTQTNAALSTQYCSAAVTPTGYDAAATVAATGTATSLGWKVNGGSFVTSGTLSPGQTISACGTSSSSNSTSTTASVTVGGVAATSPFTMTTVAGGSCTTQTLLLDDSGARQNNNGDQDSADKWQGFKVVGNGKALHSIVFKTGTADQGSAATYTVNVNTATNFGGTHTDSFTVTTPGTTETEFTATSVNKPILANGTTYYVAIGSASATWGTRLGLQSIGDAAGDNTGGTSIGLSNFTMCSNCDISTWSKVYVCD